MGTAGQATARHGNLGQGIPGAPEEWGGGHRRHPGEQGRGHGGTRTGRTGGLWRAEQGTAGQLGTAGQGTPWSSGEGRRDTQKTGKTPLVPGEALRSPGWLGKGLPARAAPGRGSRSARNGVRSGDAGARRQPCSLPRGTGSELRRKASSSAERLRARTGRGWAPVLRGGRRRPGAGEGSSAQPAAPVAASSGGAGGSGVGGAAGT